MQIKYLKSFLSAQNEQCKVTALAWSPNNVKLAACTADKVVLLFDDNGEKKDKFATKPADPKAGKGSYVVRALAFSPDSTKIAVAQSDMVFVYRIGEEWGEKKVICNKFSQPAAVTSAVWPSEGPLVCGLADGKVRECMAKANKSRTLYTGNSMVVALALNARGTGFLSGHADGTIARYYVAEDPAMEFQGRVAQHPVPPYALAWPSTGHVIAAGCDRRILVYGGDGGTVQTLDSTRNGLEREFTVACSSPSGQAVAIGSYDRIRVLSWETRRREWREELKEIRNLYSVAALAWRRDGAKVACAGLCGSIEVFESVLKRTVWRNKFEMVYVAPSQVLVRPLPGATIGGAEPPPSMARGVILRSRMGHEISDVRIAGRDEQFLVARTSHTLLLGDLSRNLLSEVPWVTPPGAPTEKFSFDNPTACLIFHAGELSLVEYGNNNILASVRTEFMNPHLVSVRINERRKTEEDNKKLAYLLDLKTICVVDLSTGAMLGQVSHDARINWLELSEPADKLLFRDSRLRLWLLPLVQSGSSLRAWNKMPLLPHCSSVQWVSGSDVVVAQSQSNLFVWYNLDTPDGATVTPIRGDVIEVVREDGKTEVIAEEGRGQRVAYALDEGMVEFGTALQDGDLQRAFRYLESISKQGTRDYSQEAMWRALAELALIQVDLEVAAKSYARLGETARTMYLEKTIDIAKDYASRYGGDGLECPEVLARLAMLAKQFKLAEDVYLRAGDVAGAIRMYEHFCMFEQALAVAESQGSPESGRLRQRVEQWFQETKQLDKIAELREKEGLHAEAIDLYLRASMPGRASRVLQSQGVLMQDEVLLERVANALVKIDLPDQAGDLWEKMGMKERALECYRKGGAFSRAVQIARMFRPAEVVRLEGEWAEHLMTQRQFDVAISHFIEAGKTSKALEAAVKGGQWRKAQQIIHVIDDKRSVRPYFAQLAKHLAAEKDFQGAEKMFLDSGAPKEAVEMYCDAGQWEGAWRVAKSCMGEEEALAILEAPGARLEAAGKLRDAEKLYLAIGQPEKAVEMYRRQRRYDEMCRLATSHLTPEQCRSLQQTAAVELQTAKAWRAAEKLLTRAGDWKAAIGMYKTQGMWEEALRVARSEGGGQAWRQVAFLWAFELGGHSAVKLLERLGLLEQAIDHACDNYQFEFGFELCRLAFPSKLSEVHYKCALALEDDGKFQQAEEYFIKSGKPKEAVLMYMHGQDFERALAVAEQHCPEDVGDVLEGHARKALAGGDLGTFEALMLRAQRAELVVQHYKDSGNWTEALRVCREHVPSKLAALESQYQRETNQRGRGRGASGSSGANDGGALLSEARRWEEAGDHRRAIETLLKVSPKNCGDPTMVARSWVKAVEMAIKFLGEEEASTIARSYGPQLVSQKQHSAAAQMFIAVDLVRDAVDALVDACEWGKAKKVAQQLDPRLEAYVEAAHKGWLRQQGQADQLADLDVTAALELLGQQAQWGKARDTARQHGAHALSLYLVLHASQLVKDGDPLQALQVYASELPVPTLDPRTLPTVRRVAMAVLAQPGLEGHDGYPTWSNLRTLLLQMVEDFGMVPGNEDLEDLLILAHFSALRSACRNVPSLATLATKLSVAMLRYTHIVPSDKAYFEAGLDCKAVGWESEALVFLNHLLDVVEGIEELESGGPTPLLDTTDLTSTDFPLNAPLPSSLSVPHAALEEAREWLLAVSMDQRIDQCLPTDERGMYPASLRLDSSEPAAPLCVISGWPVLGERVHLGARLACKEEWNRLLLASRASAASAHRAPAAERSSLEDVLRFLTNWCGALPEGFAFGL